MQSLSIKNGLFILVCALFLSPGPTVAQDPFKVAPQAYKLVLENEWVKIMRVRYGPREKIPVHDHTQWAAAYVYLNDSGPVVFKHIGVDYGAITRPATKAGSFRLYKAIKEVHEVENQSDTPSDFLRVEFKTEPVNDKTLKGRYYREAYPPGENYQKVQFENEQVRITRVVCVPAKKIEITSSSTEPTLLISLTPGHLKSSAKPGRVGDIKFEAGMAGWIGLGERVDFENLGDAPVEMLRFEFKTKPIPSSKLPEHPHR